MPLNYRPLSFAVFVAAFAAFVPTSHVADLRCARSASEPGEHRCRLGQGYGWAWNTRDLGRLARADVEEGGWVRGSVTGVVAVILEGGEQIRLSPTFLSATRPRTSADRINDFIAGQGSSTLRVRQDNRWLGGLIWGPLMALALAITFKPTPKGKVPLKIPILARQKNQR